MKTKIVKKKIIFMGIIILTIFFMSYGISFAETGCCVKPSGGGKNICVETDNTGETTVATCRANGANFVKGDCATNAVCSVTASANANSAFNGAVADTTGTAVSNGIVPGTLSDASGLIPCGRSGQNMCTLCDLIVGIEGIVKYLLKIAIGIAVLAICIGGILYIVSVGDPGLIEMGKNAMKNAIIGIIICLVAFIVINTTMLYLGSQTGLGIGITSWSEFDCSASH